LQINVSDMRKSQKFTLGCQDVAKHYAKTSQYTPWKNVSLNLWFDKYGNNGKSDFPDSVELHDVPGLALQPELVELYEEIAENKHSRLY
jgi:hypothetical protein